jgi:DNA repair protein RecN (Recombination protein N)
VVRAGALRTEISAGFESGKIPQLGAWLEEAGIAADDDTLILRRVIEAEGRSRAFINGAPVALAQLRQAAEFLLDIHGQHAHHALLRPQMQRQVLDAYGGAETLADGVNAAWRDWQAAQQQRRYAETHGRERQIERESLMLAVAELAQLGDDLARWDELQTEHARLAHVSTLIEGGHALVEGLDEGENAVLAQLGSMAARLQVMAAVDASLNEAGQLLSSAHADLSEAAHSLRRYADNLNLDPQRLAELDRRMAEMHRLARKHRVNPEALPDLQQTLQARLQALSDEDNVEGLRRAEKNTWAAYQNLAGSLTGKRKQAAAELSASVSSAMNELALVGGTFHIALNTVAEPRAYGMEDVEFQAASHPGLPVGPLARVASGGELSRISLGIQTALSGVAGVPTLIFDEVDVGIGGAVAEAVGRRLAKLGLTRQVLVITHLPQVAARGAHHLRVVKHDRGKTVTTQIEVLDRAARIEEIARMLGGLKITDTTRKHAAEMLAG